MVRKRKCTGTLSTLKSTAIGLSCAVAIRPPVATSVISAYITQNWAVEAICQELNSMFVCRCLTVSPAGACFHDCGSQPCGGALRNRAATTTAAPWMMPHWMNAVWYPARSIRLAMGATVSADPAPNPAAVMPAASPRWSGNHLSALPMAVP